MSEHPVDRPRRSHIVWPGFGLVMGAGLGSVVGLLVDPTYFFFGTGGGGGLGLVVGAIVEQSREPP